jgi:hypothetical protein
MVELFPRLFLWGASFSPHAAELATGLELTKKVEPGEIALRGRYKGKPRPYGAAEISVPQETPPSARLSSLLQLSAPHLEALKRIGASCCHVHIDVRYWDQCNLEFEPAEIRRIAELGLALTISCYDYSGREEPASVE